MILLFEGLDKVGKSTLIRNFQDLSQMPVFKNPIKPDKLVYSHGFVNGTYFGAYLAAKLSGKDIIFDRSHITEIAYAKVKRGYEPQEKDWLDWEELNKHYVVVVYVTAPLDTIRERFKTDKEEYLVDEDIDAINTKYNEYLKESKLSIISVDGSLDRQRMLTQLVVQLQNLGFWTALHQR